MAIVLITAFGVGISTLIGSILSFFVRKISHKHNDMILSFAAGIMLTATFFSLILPALSFSHGIWFASAGIVVGAIFISVMDRLVPHIHHHFMPNGSPLNEDETKNFHRLSLFLIAIAIHNFPEGMAVGVSFGNADIKNALAIAVGVSLQNIPEGLITVLPLVLAGVSKKKALLIGLVTGSSEIIGVLVGYATVQFSLAILPFILALAAGTMLYVISNDMIPETHSHGYEKYATFSLVFGVICMLLISSTIGA